MDTPEGPILGRYASCPVAGAVSHSGPLWDTGPGAILRHLQVVAGTMTSQAESGIRRSSRRGAQCRLEAAARRVAASPGDQMLPDTARPRTHRGSSVKP